MGASAAGMFGWVATFVVKRVCCGGGSCLETLVLLGWVEVRWGHGGGCWFLTCKGVVLGVGVLVGFGIGVVYWIGRWSGCAC